MQKSIIKILFIGIGEMGKYHLQSILNSRLNHFDLDITQIDPSPKNIITGFKYYSNLSKIEEKKFDMAFINTKSDVRFRILEQLLLNFNISFIYLEKLLFNSLKNYDYDFSKTHPKIKCWSSIRLQKLHKLSSNFIYDSAMVEIRHGSLITDLIHVVDFYLPNSQAKDLEVSNIDMLSAPFPSKRVGFIEMSGELRISNIKTKKHIHFISKKHSPNFKVTLKSNDKMAIIDEDNSLYTEQNHNEKIPYLSTTCSMRFQSEMTGDVIYQEFIEKKEILMSLEAAVDLHKAIYFPIIKHHQNLAEFRENDIFPFT